MFEIAVMNPRRARKKRRTKRSTSSMKRNKKGRFVKRASNPRKRRRAKHRASNPRKRRREKQHAARASNPRRRRRHNPRRHRAHRRRSNPRFSLGGIQSGAVGLLKEGAVGGAGALVNAVLLGYALPFLPATFTTGYALDAVRIVSATGLAMV